MNEINHFLVHKAKNTQNAYMILIRQVEGFTKKPFIELTTKQAVAFLSSLTNRAPATLKHRYILLHSIFEFFYDMQMIPFNPIKPAGRIISWRQAAQVRPTKMINPLDVVKILKQPKANTKTGIHDRAMLSLLFGGGFRKSEILALNVGDLKVNNKNILVVELRQTKAGKRQLQPIAKFAYPAISELISQRKSDGATENDPLLVYYYAKTGKVRNRLDVRTLDRRFIKYCRAIGVSAAPHSARVSYVSQLKRMGVSDREVANALRHSGDRMVKVYDKRIIELEAHPGIELKYFDVTIKKSLAA